MVFGWGCHWEKENGKKTKRSRGGDPKVKAKTRPSVGKKPDHCVGGRKKHFKKRGGKEKTRDAVKINLKSVGPASNLRRKRLQRGGKSR